MPLELTEVSVSFQVKFKVDKMNRENSTDFQRRCLTKQALDALKKAADEFKDRNRFVRDVTVNIGEEK